jgi:hypothetical protein
VNDDTTATQQASVVAALLRVPAPATLVFVVNPSRHVRPAALRHAAAVLRVTRPGRLNVTGIFEQATADDGPPFDRVLLATTTPPPPPSPHSAPAPSSCTGTSWQKAQCRSARARAYEQAVVRARAWRARLERDYRAWVKVTVAKLNALSDLPTEESASWNIRAALLRAGQALTAEGTPGKCVVLLGGLAVNRPPTRLPVGVLAGATILAPGWRGTERIQREWRARLEPAGARIVFLPGTVTELELGRFATQCTVPGAQS